MAHPIVLGGIDYAILLLYFLFVLGIGWALKRCMKGSTDFFLSGRSIPAWVAGLAFISANLGAQEVIGMAASGAKYGIMTSHFYWVGAIPAMVFLGIFMMPFYYGSQGPLGAGIPEAAVRREDAGLQRDLLRGDDGLLLRHLDVRAGQAARAAAGLEFRLQHVRLRRDRAGLYLPRRPDVGDLQRGAAVLHDRASGSSPLVCLGLQDVGGWAALKAKLIAVATSQHFAPGTWTESWQHMGSAAANPMGVEWFGMAMGLGFVLSFGYWCTDFLVVQRAMAANSMSAARRTPLIAAFPKMLFPFLVILPGMIAIALTRIRTAAFTPPVASDGDAQLQHGHPDDARRTISPPACSASDSRR